MTHVSFTPGFFQTLSFTHFFVSVCFGALKAKILLSHEHARNFVLHGLYFTPRKGPSACSNVAEVASISSGIFLGGERRFIQAKPFPQHSMSRGNGNVQMGESVFSTKKRRKEGEKKKKRSGNEIDDDDNIILR